MLNMKLPARLNALLLSHQILLVAVFIGAIFTDQHYVYVWLYGLIAFSAIMHLAIQVSNILYIPNIQADISVSRLPSNETTVKKVTDTIDKEEPENQENIPEIEPPGLAAQLNKLMNINKKLSADLQKTKQELEKAKGENNENKNNLNKKIDESNELKHEYNSLIQSLNTYEKGLLDSLNKICRDNNLTIGLKSIQAISKAEHFNDRIRSDIDFVVGKNEVLSKRLDSLNVEDRYEFMTDAFIKAYRLWIDLLKWYNKRYSNEQLSGIQLDIELALITKNIFDSILFYDFQHSNYKILEGQSFSELKEGGEKINASELPPSYREYINYCQNNNIELEVFMEYNVLCPIWIKLDQLTTIK